MATEIYSNLFHTAIASNYTAGSGTLIVASMTGAPSTTLGNWRVLLDRGGANVLLKVTGASGTTLTVVAEQNDASLASGKSVDGVITKDALEALKTDAASLIVPSAASSAPAKALPMTGWTIRNGAVFSNFSQDAIGVFIPPNGSVNFRFITQPLSAPPYTVIAKLDARMYDQTVNTGASAQSCGVYLYDGTKFESIEIANIGTALQLQARQASSVTAAGSIVAGGTSNLVPPSDFAVKIVDDSTHRTFYYYTNSGWTQFFQEATAAFLTPTSVGVGGIDTSGGGSDLAWCSMNLKYWSIT